MKCIPKMLYKHYETRRYAALRAVWTKIHCR